MVKIQILFILMLFHIQNCEKSRLTSDISNQLDQQYYEDLVFTIPILLDKLNCQDYNHFERLVVIPQVCENCMKWRMMDCLDWIKKQNSKMIILRPQSAYQDKLFQPIKIDQLRIIVDTNEFLMRYGFNFPRVAIYTISSNKFKLERII